MNDGGRFFGLNFGEVAIIAIVVIVAVAAIVVVKKRKTRKPVHQTSPEYEKMSVDKVRKIIAIMEQAQKIKHEALKGK